MQLDLHRKWLKKGYSIGILSIDGKRFCESVEDEDRGLKQTDSLETIKAKKVKGKTAIPVGTYEIKITYSQRFKKNLPLLLNVPGFDGIRIHSGNTADDTEGCLIYGKNTEVGKVTNSRFWTNQVIEAIALALQKERVFIKIHY
jgi:hypothetical protein